MNVMPTKVVEGLATIGETTNAHGMGTKVEKKEVAKNLMTIDVFLIQIKLVASVYQSWTQNPTFS